MMAGARQPFLTLRLHEAITRVTSLVFSSNGEHILVGAEGGAHYIYDGFDTASRLLFVLRGHDTPPPKAPAASAGARSVSAHDLCWTPDGRFVLTGTKDGSGQVCVWEIPGTRQDVAPAPEELDCIARLNGPRFNASAVAFNPRRALLVTAGQQVCFWLPSAEAAGIIVTPDSSTQQGGASRRVEP